MNAQENGRITVVACDEAKPAADWNYVGSGRTIFIDSVRVARFAVLHDADLDVERIVIDRSGGAEAFLDLLANLPGYFTGDAMFIRDDGGGFLSATGRGGDRVVYALDPSDIRFYLETHQLVTGRTALRMTA